MNILGISCSPRKSGNTALLVEQALKGAQSEGAEVELLSLSGLEIKPCDGCLACRGTGRCHIDDDMQTVYEKLLAADGIIFGTPAYFYSLTAQAKTLIDRTMALNRRDRNLNNKVGGIIAIAGSIGLIDLLKDFYFFIVVQRMVPAGFVAAYATEKGDIKSRPKANQAAWDLGREMVHIVNKKFEYPSEFKRSHYAFGTRPSTS